jgi:hydroxymethylpyrimidine/phosphomethylpyrimidine kinase
MNLRYVEDTIEGLSGSGLMMSSFSRSDQQGSGDTMTWGTELAIKKTGTVPDIIYDEGEIGKEPMIRLLAKDARELVNKLKTVMRGVQ